MDRNEALNLFVRNNFKLILSKDFLKETFRKAKLSFFLDGYKNVGVPRDMEIAEKALYYLIKNGAVFDDTKLAEILSLPFFVENVRNKEPFEEFLRLQKSTIATIEPKKLAEAEFRDRLRQEIRAEVIEDETKEISDAIERKKEEYDLLPSVLDQAEFQEPTNEVLSIQEEYVPWWRRLSLSGDPFPNQEGLQKIADELYEKVVYKTQIFEKYTVWIKEYSDELFKDTIFFGYFGSGKTTLFDYLKKPLINEKLFALRIQLFAESAFQALLTKFYKKLFERLCGLHELIFETDPRGWLTSTDYQDNVKKLLQKFSANENVRGLIIIIDNLHKNFDEFEIAMKFVNYLQLFKCELVEEIPQLNLGIFVAGSDDWERTIKNNPKFQGSYVRYETMPPITEEIANEMLNRRLSAFATNPDTIKTIDIGFVRRVYRGLQNDKESHITFRSFMKAALQEFEKGNFSILTVDPVHIPKENLNEIKVALEWNSLLKKKIDNLLFGGGIQREENRKKTLELLVYVYLKRGISEDSAIFEDSDNKFSLQRLARSSLIQKAKTPIGPKWVICRELDEANKMILKDYHLSLEDYLTKLYVAPLGARVASKIEKPPKDLAKIDLLINILTNQQAKNLAKESRKKHEVIVNQMEKHERSPESANAISDCLQGFTLLTKALLVFLGSEIPKTEDLIFLKGFWRTFWFSPVEITEFINQVGRLKESKLDDRVWYSCTVYKDAYDVLLDFFEDEVDESRYVVIPIVGLTNDEISQFHEIRAAWGKKAYFEVADQTTRLVEKKLRAFLFNVFSLLYGDQPDRLNRLDKETRSHIALNTQKEKAKGGIPSRNEFEQVNRGNYKNFLIGSYNKDIGAKNWKQLFKQVFVPINETEIKSFLDIFADFNIATSHGKEGTFGAVQPSNIFSYVVRSIDIVKKMNEAYVKILDEGLHTVENQTETRRFFFSLFGLEDKSDLKPSFVKNTEARRVVEQLLGSKEMSIDLEDGAYIESYFSIDYRVFITILARLLKQTPKEASKTGMRVEIVSSKGSVVDLRLTKMA